MRALTTPRAWQCLGPVRVCSPQPSLAGAPSKVRPTGQGPCCAAWALRMRLLTPRGPSWGSMRACRRAPGLGPCVPAPPAGSGRVADQGSTGQGLPTPCGPSWASVRARRNSGPCRAVAVVVVVAAAATLGATPGLQDGWALSSRGRGRCPWVWRVVGVGCVWGRACSLIHLSVFRSCAFWQTTGRCFGDSGVPTCTLFVLSGVPGRLWQ